MTRNFNLLGEIDNYESLMITRSWHGIGVLEMRINRYKQHVDKLQRNNIIFPYNRLDCGFVILYKEIEINESGKASENWLIRAESLKAWFKERTTIPPVGESSDAITADAETVMRHYVKNNVVEPYKPGFKMSDIYLADNKKRGEVIEWQSRYKNLADELEKISKQSGLGWNVEIDYENKRYVFVVNEGKDLTASQSDLPPIIFSTEFETLKELQYVESDLNYKNFAIVAGQGEGADRRIVMVGDADGIDRRVLFVDARDIEEEDSEGNPLPDEEVEQKLRNRGKQRLSEYEQEFFLEGQALTKSIAEYRKGYNLGDMVTLQSKDWGVSMDARVTAVTETYEENSYNVDLTFNNDRPTIIDKIKQEIENVNAEVTR